MRVNGPVRDRFEFGAGKARSGDRSFIRLLSAKIKKIPQRPSSDVSFHVSRSVILNLRTSGRHILSSPAYLERRYGRIIDNTDSFCNSSN